MLVFGWAGGGRGRARHVIETGYSLIRILNPDALSALAAYLTQSLTGPAPTERTPPALTARFLPCVLDR